MIHTSHPRYTRPKRTAVVNARVEPECREALERYARRHGFSLADALSRLIKQHLMGDSQR